MKLTKKQRSQQASEAEINRFNRYDLHYKDYKGETYFKLVGTQVVQNYNCDVDPKKFLDDYRNSIK